MSGIDDFLEGIMADVSPEAGTLEAKQEENKPLEANREVQEGAECERREVFTGVPRQTVEEPILDFFIPESEPVKDMATEMVEEMKRENEFFAARNHPTYVAPYNKPTQYETLIEMLEGSIEHEESMPELEPCEFANVEEVREAYGKYQNAHVGHFDAGSNYEIGKATIELLENILKSYKNDVRTRRTSYDKSARELEKARADYSNLVEEYRNASALKENEAYFDEIAKNFKWWTGVVLPNGEEAKIYPHQYQAAKQIAASKQLILGDDMGTGKTLTAIASMDLAGVKKGLIITPANITEGFLEDVKRWTDRPVINLNGMDSFSRGVLLDAFKAMERAVLVLNYEVWRKDISVLEDLIDAQFEAVYIDEAHYMKNRKSLTAQGVALIVHSINKCPHCGERVAGRVYETTRTKTIDDEWRGIPFPYVEDATYDKQIVTGYNREIIGCVGCSWNGHAIIDGGKTKKEIHYSQRSVQITVPMTGTPILNSPEDLFPMLNLIDPTTFFDIKMYQQLYCEMDPYTGKWSFQPGGQARLVDGFLRGRFIARTMEDVQIELPPMHKNRIYVEIDPIRYAKQCEVIEQIQKNAEILLESGEALSITAVIAEITRMRQAVTYPPGIQIKKKNPFTRKEEVVFSVGDDVSESAKVDKVMEMVHDFKNKGERVVIFSQFTEALNGIRARMESEGIRAVVYAGPTPNKLRNQIKHNFDRKFGEEAKWDVVLVQYKSGREGLNFTAARHLILLDKEWNPGCESQAIRRVLRIGQTEETYLWDVQAKNSIDHWMQGLIDTKADMIAGFEESAREVQSELFDQLKAMLVK